MVARQERSRGTPDARREPNGRLWVHLALEIPPGKDAHDARQRGGLGDVQTADTRVSVRRAEQREKRRARQREVVDVAPHALDERRVLPPPHRGADQPRAHQQ